MGINKSYLKDKFLSTKGYKRNSPDVNNPYNVIPSNRITMKDVDFPVMGIDDMGNQQMMYPGNDYIYPGNYVTEFPLKNMGNKRFGQKGLYKPDFRSKSQIANERGQQREYTNVPVQKTPAEAKAVREKQLAELKRKTVGTIRETTDADREAQNRQALTFAGNAAKRGASSPLNDVLDMVNPFSYYYSAKDIGRGLGEVAEGVNKLDLKGRGLEQIGSGLTQAGLNALYVLPAASELKPVLKGAGKYLTTQTPLKNTYKINPWRFRENPEAYYHRSPNLENIINQERGTLQGFGASEAGKIFNKTAGPGRGLGLNLKKPANSELYFSKGVPLDYGRTNMILDKSTGKLIPGQGYEGPYLVEVTNTPFVAKANGKFRKVFDPETGEYVRGKLPPTGKGHYAVSKEPISIDNAKFYKEDWLRGYKPVEVPKSTSNFKSEIDWAKWNPDTPKYPELINEYNAIEETTKKAGTWMKNPDGSAFQGTPEQFIQQQSSHFKKAFGDSKLVNPDGSPMFLYHGSAKKFDTFDPSKFQLGDAGYSGAGIYTTPSKTTANSYATSSAKFHSGDIEPTVYKLYGQANNPISSEELINQGDLDLFNFYRKSAPVNQQLLNYDAAIHNQQRGVQRVRPWNDAWEIVFPTNKQLKSAVGNVGFFDMTNPNIYKGVLPYALPLGAAAGAGAYQQFNQKPKGTYQMGGTIGIPGVNGQVVSSGPTPLTSVRKTRGPINKTKKGDVKTMSSKQVKQTLKYSKQKPNKI